MIEAGLSDWRCLISRRCRNGIKQCARMLLEVFKHKSPLLVLINVAVLQELKCGINVHRRRTFRDLLHKFCIKVTDLATLILQRNKMIIIGQYLLLLPAGKFLVCFGAVSYSLEVLAHTLGINKAFFESISATED